MASHTTNGKAFEYACLKAMQDKLCSEGKIVLVDKTPAYFITVDKFNKLSVDEQAKYMDAANAAVKLIFPLEPRIENGEGELRLAVNADAAAQGINGDVRDVLCIRCNGRNGNWEIGLSCKHNHEALKHPRITSDKDFGENWIGIPNSAEFINEISTTIDTLADFAAHELLWKDIAATDDEKWDKYYVPILEAYRKEIIRLCDNYDHVPQKLLSYFFGSKDFYKVIMKEKQSTTTVEAFNMHNTLGQKAGTIKPMTKVSVIKLPTRLIEAEFKVDSKGVKSKTTIVLVFDGGWTISMRLHNKDDKVKLTSLAWDVQLIGLPTGTYVNTHSWYE